VTLPASMLARLPPPRPGRHRRPEPEAGVLSTVTVRSEHHNELKFVDSVLERPTLRAGSIGIMVRDEQGKIQRLPGIGFFDNDQGRYVTTVKRGSDGEDWTTLSPSDNARIAHRLAETLVEALRQ